MEKIYDSITDPNHKRYPLTLEYVRTAVSGLQRTGSKIDGNTHLPNIGLLKGQHLEIRLQIWRNEEYQEGQFDITINDSDPTRGLSSQKVITYKLKR